MGVASSRSTSAGSTAGRRRSGLSPERIVAAALVVIERDPRAPLVLSTVAAELGVATMSLYTHMRSREELMDAVREAALARFQCLLRSDDPWERQLEQLLRALREHVMRYPFLALEPAESPVIWPNLLVPLFDVLRRAGLEGTTLAEAARWLGRSIGCLALLEQCAPIGDSARYMLGEGDVFTPEQKRELGDVLVQLAASTPEGAFDFAVARAIAAIRDLAH